MKKTIKHIRLFLFILPAFCLWNACIDQYTPTGIEEISSMLVVDGKISGDSTLITLSRSVGLTQNISDITWIDNAIVRVEREDGVSFGETVYRGDGVYFIPVESLQKGKKYRLYIKTGSEEYVSEYLEPLFTPEVEEITWDKENSIVSFYVSTKDPEAQSDYYQWSYRDTWEFNVDFFADAAFEFATEGNVIPMNLFSENNRYYCWNHGLSNTLILGSSDKLKENVISRQKIAEFDAKSERFMTMYYLRVTQSQIRKSTYEYYYNLQKNVEDVGSIFTPIPSELHGNIVNVANPGEVVIGYVDVSSAVHFSKYFPLSEGIYETSFQTCQDSFVQEPGYGLLEANTPRRFAPLRCVDCRTRGTKQKPADWPTDHL